MQAAASPLPASASAEAVASDVTEYGSSLVLQQAAARAKENYASALCDVKLRGVGLVIAWLKYIAMPGGEIVAK